MALFSKEANLKQRINEVMDEVFANTKKTADRAGNQLSEYVDTAREYGKEARKQAEFYGKQAKVYGKKVSKVVEKNPLKSLLCVAAIGAVIGMLIKKK